MNKRLSRARDAIAHGFYGLYAWFLFLPTVLFSFFCAVFLPGLERRRFWVSRAARLFFACVGMRATVTGLQQLPTGDCIVVANHSSFVDGVILYAFLPPRFSFVIKGEVRRIPVLHFVLRRVGSKFVERFAATGSSRDARTLLKAAANGESLAIFPEGTFIARPGLGRFRPGAFSAALKGGLPIVPVAIRGSRKVMPAKTFWPKRASLQIDIQPPIQVADGVIENSAALGEIARQSILEVLDEPDLLLSDSPAPNRTRNNQS